MAYLQLYRNKLIHNFQLLDKLFKQNNIDWAVTTKLLCGDKCFMQEVLDLKPKQICDSRISNLAMAKKLRPQTKTIYIKPPPKNAIKSIVRYADISLNTEYETIKLLSKEASRQGKLHGIIIMIEMGDLREGVMGSELITFYSKVFRLKGIKVLGVGANLNCLNGIMPSHDKLVQLGLYKQIIELKFKQKISIVSGGSTVTIPLLLKKQLPSVINHFRVGEALFFGADLFNKKTLKGYFPNAFQLFSEIIELNEKPYIPIGEMDENPSGETFEINPKDYGKKGYRAILDIGKLDVDPKFLTPVDKDITVIGASSDMLVVEFKRGKKNYKIGSTVKFDIKYMGVLGLMNSNYIEKVVI